jgi:hypothetical protein
MDDPIHELLLRLAGRVDDDLLADARELVAVGEDGHALELVTAALAADATPLPPPVRAELVDAATAARIDLDADAALAPAAPDTTAHRFSATANVDVPVVAAARELPDRLRAGVRLRLTWRQTPAGPAPTPLPQPVLLVETPEDGRPGEVLAYQVGAAMARSGVHVAVEVLTTGRPLTGYHAAALRDSTPLSGDAPPRPASPAEKVESVVAEVVEQVTASHRPAPPEDAPGDERPGDLFAVEDGPAPRPVPMRSWQGGRRRRFGEQAAEELDDGLPEEESPLPSPVPLARRTRPRPVGGAEQPDPLIDPIPDEGSWSDEWASGDWAVAETAEPVDTGTAETAGPHRPTGPAARLGVVGNQQAGANGPDDRGAPNGRPDGPEGNGPHTPGPRGFTGPQAILRSMPGGPGAGTPFGAPARDARGSAPSGPGTDASALDARGSVPSGPSPDAAAPGGRGAPAPDAATAPGTRFPGAPDGRPGAAGHDAPVALSKPEPAVDTPGGAHALFTDHSTPPQGVDQPAPVANGPAHALADPPTGPLPVIGSPTAEALLKPEALARLSDADRELLTRLQAELSSGNGPNGATPA